MFKKTSIVVGIALACALFCSYSSFVGFRAIIVVCMLLLAIENNLIFLYPIVLFFYTQFGLFLGLSVSRLFSIFFLLSLFISANSKGRLGIQRSNFLILTVYLAYITVVLLGNNVSLGISALLNTVTIALMVSLFMKKEEQLCCFFKVYIFAALLSIPAGIHQANSMVGHQVIDGVLVETSRFMGTFDDPNYFTFFCYIAIVSLLTLDIFDKRIRALLICIFQVCILSTLSITGIVCGIIIWMMYFLITHQINLKLFLLIPIMFFCAVGLYNYGLQNQDAPIIGDLSMRIYDKILSLQIGDMVKVTTGRTSLSEVHLEYYLNQGFFKMLFGGNLANTKITQLGSIRFAAHNEYIDILLNVGIVGAALFFSGFLYNTYHAYKEKCLDKTKEKSGNCIILMKLLWLLYAGTLTLFLEERFMLFVFL